MRPKEPEPVEEELTPEQMLILLHFAKFIKLLEEYHNLRPNDSMDKLLNSIVDVNAPETLGSLRNFIKVLQEHITKIKRQNGFVI